MRCQMKRKLLKLKDGMPKIPVVWDNPNLWGRGMFFSVMEADADKTIFVHCYNKENFSLSCVITYL